MAKVQQGTVELGGYVCPTCRLVFAADVSQLGEQVNCPGCHHLVQIPREGEEERKLHPRKSKKYVQVNDSAEGEESLIRVDRRKPDWDRGNTHPQSGKEAEEYRLPWVWILPAGAIGLALFGVLLSMIFNAKPIEPTKVDQNGLDEVKLPTELVHTSEVADEREEYKPSVHGELLEEAITKFLTATSIEELLPVVRRTKGVEARMKNYYSTHEMEKRDLKMLIQSVPLFDDPSKVSFEIRLSDYSTKNGQAQLIDGKMYIDWETYVVYSEMPWNVFAAEKKTTPITIRTISNVSSYYNFDFEDDEWTAFELSSPVEEATFVGYVPKSSALSVRLNPIGSDGKMEVTLKVRYPENAVSSNQVIIEDIVDTKWMIDELETDK